MGIFSASYCRIPEGKSPELVIEKLLGVAKQLAANPAALMLRFRYRENHPWIVVEFLDVRDLDDDRAENQLLKALMATEPYEWISMMAHGSSSTGIYAHWVNGWLRRYLIGSDYSWCEMHGQPEPWEAVLFHRDEEEPWTYEIGTPCPMSDSTILELAKYLSLPGSVTDVLNPPKDYWAIDVPSDESFWVRAKAAAAAANDQAAREAAIRENIRPNTVYFEENPTSWTN